MRNAPCHLPLLTLLAISGACSGGSPGGDQPEVGPAMPAAQATDASTTRPPADTLGTGDAGGALADGSMPGVDGLIDGGAPPAATGCDAGSSCGDAAAEDSCRSRELGASVETVTAAASVLFIHDRSGSMAMDWNGQARWQAVGSAVEGALGPRTGLLRAGTIFFPSSDPNAPATCIDPTGVACLTIPGLTVQGGTCGVNPISEDDQIDFASAEDFLAAFTEQPGGAPQRYAPIPGGMTPLVEALGRAETTLADLGAPATVVVITDGDPNCAWDAAIADQIVSDWHAAGIDTYVVGLPTTTASVLGPLAFAAETTPRFPADVVELETMLGELLDDILTTGLVSCVIPLDAAPDAADELHLVVTDGGDDYDVPRDLGGGDGWTLRAADMEVELEGELCAAAQRGRFEALRFEQGCVELPGLAPL